MNNRPHSREKRVSEESSFVEKQDFSSKQQKTSSSFKRSYSSGFGGMPIGVSPFGRKKSVFSFGTLIKIIVVLFIISTIFSFVKNIFSSPSNSEQDINNNYYIDSDSVNYSNNYLDNHSVTHVSNISDDAVNYSVSSKARDKYTKILGDKKDQVTVMIYMIGTDLESQYGSATKDLNEMLHANLNDNINIVVETGGCNRWNNRTISNRYIERYTVNSQGLYKLQDKIKSEAMVNPEVLTSFIKYSAENFPANRYMLILWDHGGGSVTGYGYDEKYPQAGSMAPDAIGKAVKDSNIKFDFIGFDACLMANLETALAIEPYADYMIGSEETEPGNGWYYTNWLSKLDENTSMPTVDIGKNIIDDYINSSLNDYAAVECTQSIIDLGELASNISEPLSTFSKSTSVKLQSDDYQSVANARGNTKEFSKSSKLDQVDLIDLAINFDVDGSKELANALKSAIKYNRSANITDAYGLSAYFPYSSLSKMNTMVRIYDNINIDENYAEAIKSFASYASSGQIVTHNNGSSSTSIFDVLMGNYYPSDAYTSDSIFDVLTGGSTYYGNGYGSYDDIFGSGYDLWFDRSLIRPISNYLSKGKLVDSSSLEVVQKDGHNVVSLSDSQWDLIDNVLLNAFVDDGGGYIDLGKDNVFDWSESGDLIVDSDGTWLSINNHVVAYYMTSDIYINDQDYKTSGIIPAYLNGQRVNLIVNFTPQNPYGIIEGAKLVYENSDSQQKGLISINEGDELKFICKYYAYDGSYIDEYQLGDTYIVDKTLELYNMRITNGYIYTYCFTDIYGNSLWTPKNVIK